MGVREFDESSMTMTLKLDQYDTYVRIHLDHSHSLNLSSWITFATYDSVLV